MSSLFQLGSFQLASGLTSHFKIECDALTDEDWRTLAVMAVDILPPFGSVESVPTGGDKLAHHLTQFVTNGKLLIVDDVYTTGGSIERHRAGRVANGLVVFARTQPPLWITPLFTMR